MGSGSEGVAVRGERRVGDGKGRWNVGERAETMRATYWLAAVGIMAMMGNGGGWAAEPAGRPESLRFVADGAGFRFDTGFLSGRLRAEGRSQGLSEVKVAGVEGVITSSMGLCSHYRLLDDGARYGTAGWDWASEGRLMEDGAVGVRWRRDEGHPFEMEAVYRWVGRDTLEVVTAVTAGRELRGFEVFLASYFKGFERSLVRVREETGERFLEALEKDAIWHLFPRDKAGVGLVRDGRWGREPHPVAWTIRPWLGAPLALRQDEARGLEGVVMARPGDCFAVATPFGAEGHRSLYLSLFGRDLKEGERVEAVVRLVVGKGMGEGEVMGRYGEFVKGGGR